MTAILSLLPYEAPSNTSGDNGPAALVNSRLSKQQALVTAPSIQCQAMGQERRGHQWRYLLDASGCCWQSRQHFCMHLHAMEAAGQWTVPLQLCA